MSVFMRRFVNSLGCLGHLSDEVLCRLINDELGSVREMRAKEHLAGCWQCRVRHERLEKAVHQVVEYRQREVEPRLPLSKKWRDSYLTQLDKLLTEAAPTPWWSRAVSFLGRPVKANMTPLLASAVVIVFAGVMLLLIWQRWAQPVSASEFLHRAEAWDSNSRHADRAGVVYQKIHIKTVHKSFERDLYRDTEGRRRPRREPMAADVKPIVAELELAGVDWEQPLSAATYKDWHDRQQDIHDQVRRSGNDLLTLTTKTADGVVRSESLTVRESNFHPVERMVELRDAGSIEIAELDYAVLGWNAVNESLFEPVASTTAAVAAPPALVRALPPTAAQLEDAELQARLVLNHLNADTGEQLLIEQRDAHIEIKGIVETEQRKRELAAQLSSIPHVRQSILSVEELRNHPRSSAPVTSVKDYSGGAGQPSPLGQYMREKNRSADELSQISESLLDSCLKVQQGATALAGLIDRFPSTEQLSSASRAARAELVWNYARSINAGLDAQVASLQMLGFAPAPPRDQSADKGVANQEEDEVGAADLATSLASEVQRNQGLCRELIAGGQETNDEGSPRPAAEIAMDLLSSSARIRVLVSQWQLQSPGH